MKSYYMPCLVIAVLLAYLPGLPGGFIYDDYWNIINNPSIIADGFSVTNIIEAMTSSTAGPLGRPVAMLTFYLNYQLGGINPLGFTLVNIIIHIINAILIFVIVSRILFIMDCKESFSKNVLENKTIAFWIALIWAVHPINLTSVLYIVQRMTSLSAMFTLMGILIYISIRSNKLLTVRQLLPKITLLSVCALLAIFSKENGVLLFIYLLVIESLVFRWRVQSRKERGCLSLFFIFSVFIPVLITLFLICFGEVLTPYDGKPFNAYERLLTESRALWFYIFQIFIPQADTFSLYHDDFPISHSFYQPFTTLISIIGLSIVARATYVYRKKYTWFSFGILIFLSGHLIESTIIPLNLVYEYRNYIPSVGLVFVYVIAIVTGTARYGRVYAQCVLIGFTILLISVTASRAYDWHDPVLLSERMAQQSPMSFNAQYELGSTYIKLYHISDEIKFADYAYNAYEKAEIIGGENIRASIALVMVSASMNRQVDGELFDKIILNVRDRKIVSAEIQALNKLVQCSNKKHCLLPNDKIKKIFYTILDNEHVSERLKNNVLISFSSYLYHTSGEEREAERYIKKIVENNPDDNQYRVDLALALIKNGNEEEGYKVLKKLSEIEFH